MKRVATKQLLWGAMIGLFLVTQTLHACATCGCAASKKIPVIYDSDS